MHPIPAQWAQFPKLQPNRIGDRDGPMRLSPFGVLLCRQCRALRWRSVEATDEQKKLTSSGPGWEYLCEPVLTVRHSTVTPTACPLDEKETRSCGG